MKFERVLLGDVCELIAGFAFKSKDFETGEGRVIKITHITPPVVDMDNLAVVNLKSYNVDKIEKYIARQGDFVLAMTGATIGKIGRIEKGSAYINQRVLMFKNRDNIDKDYLYYVLQQYEFEQYVLSHIDSQSAQPNISAGTIGKYEFDLPDLDMQKKIGKFLRLFDAKIELNNKINNNLEQQLRAIFVERFTNNPALDSIQQVPLSELCSVVTKGTTPTTLGKPFVDRGINFLKAESILDNHSLDKGKFAHIDEETHDMLKRSVIYAGDIVFTIAGTLGRFALMDNDILPANTNQAVAIIRADKGKISPEYLYACFIGNWHNDYYSKRVQQAVQANLSLTTIKSLPIPVLTQDEMVSYMALISPIVRMLKQNEMENERLAILRDMLLPCLMNGEIDVSDIKI